MFGDQVNGQEQAPSNGSTSPKAYYFSLTGHVLPNEPHGRQSNGAVSQDVYRHARINKGRRRVGFCVAFVYRELSPRGDSDLFIFMVAEGAASFFSGVEARASTCSRCTAFRCVERTSGTGQVTVL